MSAFAILIPYPLPYLHTIKLATMKTKLLFMILVFTCIIQVNAQVKIGDNPATIDANSMLEIESGSKGFLGPRVAINNLSLPAPLTAPVPEGMLVYSDGGTVTNGFYYWDGTKWVRLISGKDNTELVIKSATSTLLKTEKFVLASNDITITLPVVTIADDGLEISVKNIGSATDLISVQGSGGALIDGYATSYLTRYKGHTYVAYNGAWIMKDREPQLENILDVSPIGSWTSIAEVLAFLGEHMMRPTVVRLCGGDFTINETAVVDLPYALTIQGATYGTSRIIPGASLAGMPMFRCVSETYFKMLDFDATALVGYGVNPGEDGIRYIGEDLYSEIKDCTLEGFYNCILDSSNAELWIFECDISDAESNGILLHSAIAGVVLRVSETDFINCKRGLHMEKGSQAAIQLNSGEYDCATATDTGIVYDPATFSFDRIIITNNSWNNVGHFIEGFDFSRPDSRDANAEISNNAGIEDKTPHLTINVVDNATATDLALSSSWYKCEWINTTNIACKWIIDNNKITYQPDNIRDAFVAITGNVTCNSSSRVITIALVKNGNVSSRFGECNLRITNSNQPFQFSTVIYLQQLVAGDYFELYCKANANGVSLVFQDVQWYVNTQ
ncbi:MAG: hypothetical protein CVU11_05135 [Bacteroidetes bacterium HGW-Bacteroidetes-6]|nr:MAG: hypothetical protein CVU11_05135 [Bacteroidetes bacterium HGW-Bacteroidetes-6]